jgi:hypothetical protein
MRLERIYVATACDLSLSLLDVDPNRHSEGWSPPVDGARPRKLSTDLLTSKT